jgi:hypothetical protein
MTAIWQNDGTGWRLLAPVGLGAPEPVTKATGPEPVRAPRLRNRCLISPRCLRPRASPGRAPRHRRPQARAMS